MARIDKYESKTGGFRAPLATAWVNADLGVPYGVGLDAAGRVVKGAGNSGIKGVLVLTKALPAGAIVDVGQDMCLVEFGGVPGSNYFADGVSGALAVGTGTQSATPPATAGSKYVGHTVEGSRLEVRISRTV